VAAAGCSPLARAPSGHRPHPGEGPLAAPQERPYAEVTSNHVHALVPRRWQAAPLSVSHALSSGVVASPNLEGWSRMDGSVPGLEAEWVDVAQGGIPSDFYWLAAKGPAIPRLATLGSCRANELVVILNHRPAFAGDPRSPGDYAERGTGTCRSKQGPPTRYAYFVAAPGYGPVRHVGIPNSGLYVVLAVVKNDPDAPQQLHRMLMSARFNQTSVADLMDAARDSAQLR